MIHIDVKREYHPERTSFNIETSIDGSEWKIQYKLDEEFPYYGKNEEKTRLKAETWANVFATACRFCGNIVRVTSCGYNISEG